MKRFLRILFNTLTTLSLVICLATVVLWVRSYRVADELIWCDAQGTDMRNFDALVFDYTRQIISSGGGIMFQARYEQWNVISGYAQSRHYFRWKHDRVLPYPVYTQSYPSEPNNNTCWAAAGFEIVTPKARPDFFAYIEEAKSVSVPIWAIVSVTGMLPLLWVGTWRRRGLGKARRKVGHCMKCGYDLRATPDRCPECGHVPADAAKKWDEGWS